MPFSGSFGPPNPITLFNSECSITHDNPSLDWFRRLEDQSATIKISGNLKSIALLILQSIQKQITAQTYNYNGQTMIPSHLNWGPFQFIRDRLFDPQLILPLNMSNADEMVVNDLINEMKKLEKLKALL